ncbi:MAG: methionyl-tRNA formyltransferase-like protein [Beijerinckiaceae bacterium]|nr:methionyl-tRNA formyltransferase-like protein [Beijerinckiaceae bacterium]
MNKIENNFDSELFNTIFESATAQVDEGYFNLRIDGGAPILRERVYCYELYHQFRLCWPEASPYIINGEVDKRGHPILRKLKAQQIPDFLIHSPGSMRHNHTIIEVKTSNVKNGGLKKDVETLLRFRNIVGYQRAIYLIFGSLNDRTKKRIAKNICEYPQIELWFHDKPNTPAYRYRSTEYTR